MRNSHQRWRGNFPRALMIITLVLVGLGGCSLGTSGSGPESGGTFVTSSTWENQFTAQLAGSSHGYQAGEQASFAVTLTNESDHAWRGRYCLALLDNTVVASATSAEELSLSPHQSVTQDNVEIPIPEGLGDGPYRVALTVPEWGNHITTVWVGEQSSGDTAQFEPVGALPCQ